MKRLILQLINKCKVLKRIKNQIWFIEQYKQNYSIKLRLKNEMIQKTKKKD